MADNPYKAGDVLNEEDAFIGRSEALQQALDNLTFRDLIFLHGQRRIGKSSLLARIELALKEATSGYYPVLIDLQGLIGRRSVDELAQLFARAVKRRCRLELPDLTQHPKPAEALKTHWLNAAVTEAVQRKPKGLVLLLDEFDDIPRAVNNQTREFYQLIADLLRSARFAGLKIVAVLGRDLHTQLEEVDALLRPAMRIRVTLLSRKEIDNLVGLSQGSLVWLDEARDQLWDLTRGHPLMAQSICATLWYRRIGELTSGSAPMITGADVEAAFSYDDYGHIIFSSWDILTLSERVILSYLAHAAAPLYEQDILHFIAENELADLYRDEPLYDVLVRLDHSEWVGRVGNTYEIKVPIFRRWISEHHALREVINQATNNQQTALALALEALQAADLPSAIAKLERAYRLDPENEQNRADLEANFREYLDVCLEEGHTKLAAQVAEQYRPYNPAEATRYQQRIEAAVQTSLLTQEIGSLVREDDFSVAAQVARRLGRYNRLASDEYFRVITGRQLAFIFTHSLYNLLLWAPLPLVAISLGQASFPVAGAFTFNGLHLFILAVTLGAAGVAAVFESFGQDRLAQATGLGFVALGVLYNALGLFLVPGIDLPIRVLVSLFLGLTAAIAGWPGDDRLTRATGASLNLLIVLLICLSGDFLVHGQSLIPGSLVTETADQLAEHRPDVPGLIWDWLMRLAGLSRDPLSP